LRQNNQKFLSPVAAAEIGFSQNIADHIGKRHQNIISGLVSELVINIFEFIKINHRQRKNRAGTDRAVMLGFKKLHQMTTIIKARQVIMYRHGLDFFHRGLKLLVAHSQITAQSADVAADERNGSKNNTQSEPVKNLQFEMNSLRPVNLKQTDIHRICPQNKRAGF